MWAIYDDSLNEGGSLGPNIAMKICKKSVIEWDDNVVKNILQMIKKFPFFSGYTLSSEDI